MVGTIASEVANLPLRNFNVAANALTGVLPPIDVHANEFENCYLMDSLEGGSDSFSCPWPEGALDKCQKINRLTDSWEPISNSDCIVVPTPPPTPAPPTPSPTPVPPTPTPTPAAGGSSNTGAIVGVFFAAAVGAVFISRQQRAARAAHASRANAFAGAALAGDYIAMSDEDGGGGGGVVLQMIDRAAAAAEQQSAELAAPAANGGPSGYHVM